MAASRASERSAREIHDTKQRAVKFYKENGIPEKLEDILNSMFYENPPDVYGRLSEYFETLSKIPTISKVVAREVIDSKGQPTLQADVYCIVKGLERFIATSTVASYNNLPENAPQDKKELDDKERQDNVTTALAHIQTHLAHILVNVNPCQQQVIDNQILEIANKLKQDQDEKQREEQEKAAALEAEASQSATGMPAVKEVGAKSVSPKGKKKLNSAKSGVMIPEEPKEELLVGASAVCVLSQTVLLAGAAIKKCQPFEYIASLNTEKTADSFEIPTPMMNIVNSGKAASGKQIVVKELLLIPKPGVPLQKSVKQVVNIYNQIGKMMAAKQAFLAGNYPSDPPASKGLQRMVSRANMGSRMSGGSRMGMAPGGGSRMGMAGGGAPSRLGSMRGTTKESKENQGSVNYVNDMGGYCPTVDRPEQLLDTVQEAISNVGLTQGEDMYYALNCAAHEMFDMRCVDSVNYVNDMGGYCPTVDRPEQLLDTVQEAISNVGLTQGEDMYYALNCAAHEMFDMEKAKYEITSGVLKTCDDLIEFYADLVNRYPAIVALIDPLRKHDVDGWTKLCERLSEQCFIIGDCIYPRPERLVQEGFGELRSSAVGLKLQRLTTVSDFIHAAQVTKDDNALVMVADVHGAASDPLLADMAVGIGAKFVKFGAPSRGERVAQYNRLIQISECLERQGKLCTPSDSFNFPILKAPTPDTEETVQDDDA